MSQPSTSYDEVPYPSSPMPQTHPERLAALAWLFGLKATPANRCRVLEIGCADAGNLIAIAESLPESEFLGVDLSARHIAAGQEFVRELGLANVTLRQQDILQLPEDLGRFDYVIAHGIYSWIPEHVQDRLLAFCRAHLAERGLAFISYNVYPGWHLRGMARSLMQYHTRLLADPKTQIAQARDLIPMLLETVPKTDETYRAILQEEQKMLEATKDAYIFHEHLEKCNAPVYFHEFAGRIGRFGLKHVTDFSMNSHGDPRLPESYRSLLVDVGKDPMVREQYYDFLRNRMFRQSLLCHAEASLRPDPEPEALRDLHLGCPCSRIAAGDIHSTKLEEFSAPNGFRFQMAHPIAKAAYAVLAENWPRCLSYPELEAAARARLAGDGVALLEAEVDAQSSRLLIQNLWPGVLADLVELHTVAPALTLEPGERPRTTSLARYQAARGTRITTCRLELAELSPLSCQLLRFLDGAHDRPALVDALVRAIADNNLSVIRHGRPVTDPDRLRDYLSSELDANLHRLARKGLITIAATTGPGK